MVMVNYNFKLCILLYKIYILFRMITNFSSGIAASYEFTDKGWTYVYVLDWSLDFNEQSHKVIQIVFAQD